MNLNKMTLESQNLIVDYMTVKFQQLEDSSKTTIAKDLFQIGFNSYQESGKLAKPIKESIFVDAENQFEVCFVGDNDYRSGTLVSFSGLNASRFYFLLKKEIINWTIFSSGVLSRFDLYYLRVNQKDDKMSIQDFMYQSFEELKQTRRKVSLEKNPKGSILKIGSRNSNLYYRIYDGKNFVKFEHEMKGKFLQNYHSLLVESQFEEFEKQLSSHFLTYSGKELPLNYSYMDWLVVKLRPIKYQQVPKNYLNSHYMYSKPFQSFSDRKDFLCLLQFLVYVKTLDYIPDALGTTCYRQVTFQLQDFLKYQNPNDKSTNYNYKKIKTLITFFEKVQANSLIQIFTDSEFISLMTIPKLEFEKSKKNVWILKVWIAKELFYYAHPFILPNFPKEKLTKDELEVQFKSIQIFSSVSLEKKFLIREFLESYPSVLSNQKKTKIKKLFLQFVASLKEHDLIESNYKVISDGYYRSVEELTTLNISEGFIIYEKLSI